MIEYIIKELLKNREIDEYGNYIINAECDDLHILAKSIEKAISVTRCCEELPEIEDLIFRLENVDNEWYSKNEHSRTAYELGANNTFYWMRKEIIK